MLSRNCDGCPYKKGRLGCENQFRYLDIEHGERTYRCRIDGSLMFVDGASR